ncbi:MAG TPA: hypothetical protein VHC72_20385 [Bryobacteraceae bacterium]|nr:hypothetical protein [Bryobacteraceae bacterium]
MKPGFSAGILAALLTLSLSAPAQDSPQPPTTATNAERTESGSMLSAEGQSIEYRIRLLPVSSFPDLPAAVAAELNRRGCMIPQSFEAKQPENVIHGAFRAAGSSDWAALCSVHETTTLYVFFAGADAPITLRSQPDAAWLAAEPGNPVPGSAWGIANRPVEELRSTPALRRKITIDHDAIDDARLERSQVLHYYSAGQWVILDGQ